MNKDKQIEKIQAEIIRWGENADKTGNYRYNLSEHLVDNGYRKASEVAKEIFEEIDVLIVRRMIPEIAWIDDKLITDISKLKKKYTEGENDNE